MGCLYVKIFDSGKMYVGITNNYDRRMYEHQKDAYTRNSNLPVHRAMRKYNHKTEIWADGIDDRDLLNRLEIQTIAQLKDAGVELYNISLGGDGCTCSKTEEWKRNISKALSNGNAHWCGKKIPEDIKRKIGDSVRGEKNGFYGKKHTDETRRRMSESKIKPKEYYETHSLRRPEFKTICNRLGWNFDDFTEMFSEYYIKPSGCKVKKFIYKFNGGK